MKGGGNTIDRIEEAIDYVSNRLSLDDDCTVATRPTPAEPIHDSLASQDLLTSCTLSPFHAHEIKLKGTEYKNEAQIPLELISHCVATLLMIQVNTNTCFEIMFTYLASIKFISSGLHVQLLNYLSEWTRNYSIVGVFLCLLYSFHQLAISMVSV